MKTRSNTSPTQRSLAMLRKHKYYAAVTEHWNPHAMIRQDLFGFCDILAFKRPDSILIESETILVQTTTAANMTSWIAKIMANHAAWVWLQIPGNKIHVHGWHKPKKSRGWVCRITPILFADFDQEPLQHERKGPRRRQHAAGKDH